MKKNFILLIYIFFIFNYIPFVYSQESSNPNQKFRCSTTAHDLKVGDEVILCIHIIPDNKKVAIKIKVDQYSMLSFNKIYDLISDKKIELIAQIGDTVSKIPTVRK